MEQWLKRPLDRMYCFIFLDCMFCKVRYEGRVQTRAVYNIMGITTEGKKELLGIYTEETEGAKFWLKVLTNLKERGVEDVLIACVDGLKGFPEAINSIFPHTEVQLCIIHQIRTSMRYVAQKDRKAFINDLKPVYKAIDEEEGLNRLAELEEKWGTKYPISVRVWYDHWAHLSPFFAYTSEIRKIMYTTNIIEGYHRQIRKVIKSKGAFPSEESLLKLMYLVVQNISKKWEKSLWNWKLTFSQLCIRFEERLKPYL